MKTCPKCQDFKGPGDFSLNKRTSDGFQSWCKKCCGEANKGRKIEKFYTRWHHIKREYGLSLASTLAIFLHQNAKCAICRSPVNYLATGHVDHDHKTGQVRGILCNACNTGIGFFKESKILLGAAQTYLETHA